MTNNYYRKTRKDSRKYTKDIKIFLKKKKAKNAKESSKKYQSFTEKVIEKKT